MDRHEADSWQEGCRLIIGGVVLVDTSVNVWSYDGRWGGEAVVRGTAELQVSDSAALVLAFEGTQHPIQIGTVSRRSANETTIHFTGLGPPPFSPHAIMRTAESGTDGIPAS